jgi:hypothetical protein
VKDKTIQTFTKVGIVFLLLLLGYGGINRPTEEMICQGLSCAIPTLKNDEFLEVKFKFDQVPSDCRTDIESYAITLMGACDSNFIIGSYLNPQIPLFGPPLVMPVIGETWKIRYEKNTIVFLKDSFQLYNHFTPFEIDLANLKVDENAFEPFVSEFTISKYSENYNFNSPVQIFLSLFLAFCLYFRWFRLWKVSNVDLPRIKINPAILIAIFVIWTFVLFNVVRIPRDRMFLSLETPIPTLAFLFSDYWQIQQTAESSKPYDFNPTMNYPPFALAMTKAFNLLGIYFGFVFLVFCCIFLWSIASRTISFSKNQKANFILMPLVFFPITYAFSRANLDAIAIVIIFLSIHQFKLKKYNYFAMGIAFASAIKIWPVVFLLLLVKRRNIKALVPAFLIYSGLQIIALIYIGYNKPSQRWIDISVQSFFVSNEGTRLETISNTSLVVAAKSLLVGILHKFLNVGVPEALNLSQEVPWAFLQLLLVLFILWKFFRIKSFAFGKELTYLCFIPLLISNPSYLYRSLVLIVLLYEINGEVHEKYKSKKKPKRIQEVKSIQNFVGMILIALSPGLYLFLTSERVPIAVVHHPVILAFAFFLYLRKEQNQLEVNQITNKKV